MQTRLLVWLLVCLMAHMVKSYPRKYLQEEGLVKVVLSLANHPRKLTQGKAPKRLSSDSIRTDFSTNQEGAGIFIEFDEDFMALEASDYVGNLSQRSTKC